MRMRLGAPLLAAVVGLLGAVQIRGRVALRRRQLRLLSAAVLRRPVLLHQRASSSADLLQAGLRHRPGEAVAHLLPDRPGNRHEAGLQDLLPRRVQDLLQDLLRNLLQDRPARRAASPATQTCYKECQYTVCKPCYKTLQGGLRDGLQAVLRDLLQGVPLHRLQEGAASAATRSAATPSASRCCETALPQGLLPPGLQAGLRAALQGVLLHRLQAGLRDLLQGRLLHRSASRSARCMLQGRLRDLLQGLQRDLLQGPACKTVCKPVTTCKTVTKKCGECVHRAVLRARQDQDQSGSKTCDECCFDPCTCCKTAASPASGQRACCKCPDQICCRKVWKNRTVCEQVPCTTTVKRDASARRCPTPSARRCPTPSSRRSLHGHPHGARRTSSRRCPTRSPGWRPRCASSRCPTRSPARLRCLRGLQGHGHDCDGPGRTFKEGASVDGRSGPPRPAAWCKERASRRCPTPSGQTVNEDVRQEGALPGLPMVPAHGQEVVPYTVCDDGPAEVCVKKVPYTVCTMQPYTVCKQVPYTVCKQVPYTVTVQGPYTVTECVPCTVCRTVCKKVPVTVCVKRAAVPVQAAPCPPPAPARRRPCCKPAPCCNTLPVLRDELLRGFALRDVAVLAVGLVPPRSPNDCCENESQTVRDESATPAATAATGGFLSRLSRSRYCLPAVCDCCDNCGCATRVVRRPPLPRRCRRPCPKPCRRRRELTASPHPGRGRRWLRPDRKPRRGPARPEPARGVSHFCRGRCACCPRRGQLSAPSAGPGWDGRSCREMLPVISTSADDLETGVLGTAVACLSQPLVDSPLQQHNARRHASPRCPRTHSRFHTCTRPVNSECPRRPERALRRPAPPTGAKSTLCGGYPLNPVRLQE